MADLSGFTFVNLGMNLEVGTLREAFLANGALVRLGTSVDAHVAIQVGAVGEAFAATRVRANVRLGLGVDVHVVLQSGGVGKGFGALGALIRLLAGVYANMLHEIGGICEGSVTLGAGVASILGLGIAYIVNAHCELELAGARLFALVKVG